MRPLTARRPRNQDKPPITYNGRRLAMPWTLRNDAEAQMRAMGNVGTLFAIVDLLANSTSAVEWKLYRKAKSGRSEDRTEITNHLALDLWHKPNDFYDRQLLVETGQQHSDLVGETWLVVERDTRYRGIPLGLWPVRPDRMFPIPSTEKFLAGYMYRSPDGEEVPLQLDEVLFMRRPNPMDPYRGIGPVQSVLADIDSARYSAEWNRNFFINGAEPGGIIKVDKRLSDPEFNEMTSRWREQHQGVSNAHRVAIIEQGEWVDRKISAKDMQFAELRNVSREVIREAYGMHGHMLGQSDDINRANAEAAEETFAKWKSIPRLRRWKSMLNGQYLPLFGSTTKNLEFDFEDPVPQNTEQENAERQSKANAAKTYIDAGFDGESVKEALELPDTLEWEKPEPPPPPVPPTPPAVPGEPPEPEPPAGPAAPGGEPQNRHVHGPTCGHQPPRPRAADDEIPPGHEIDLQRVQADWETHLDQLLGQWNGVTTTQQGALIEQIRDLLANGDIAGLANLQAPDARGGEILTAAMTAMSQAAANRIVEEAADQDVDIEPGIVPPGTLDTRANVTATLIGATLAASAAREALRQWRPGVSVDDVVAAVRDHLEGLKGTQAKTELGGALTAAQNSGRIETLKRSPVAAYYGNETLDSNTCKNCRQIDGKWLGNTVDMVEKSYPNGGYIDCLGRERCRGTVVAIWRQGQDEGGAE